MRAFVRWLKEKLPIHRAVKFPLPKLPRVLFPILSEEDIQKIWDCPQMTFTGSLGKRNRAIMFETGARRSKIAGLNVDDIDLDNELITVMGKGNKKRRIPFSHDVLLTIREWIKERGTEVWPFSTRAAVLP